MAQQNTASIQNNFTKGLLTEFTGLTFPENAATETFNCLYDVVGDVNRRFGYDFEKNYFLHTINRTNAALSSFKWDNAGGDGNTQIVVEQVGNNLYFYKSSAATVSAPLSRQIMPSTVSLGSYIAAGQVNDPGTKECQYASGNGYLIVYNSFCEPFYCVYKPSTGLITSAAITIQNRDFTGYLENFSDSTRPPITNVTHLYNLQNQGWGENWFLHSNSSNTVSVGVKVFGGVAATSPLKVGDILNISPATSISMVGPVLSYVGNTLTVNITQVVGTGTYSSWDIVPMNSYASIWAANFQNLPSNSDVWYSFKDSSDTFNPAVTISKVAPLGSPASKGRYIVDTFNQRRYTFLSNTPDEANMPTVSTPLRPRTGTWFQGRVWYTGIDANASVTGINQSWTESIYFSQIVLTTGDFGKCYQTNDPTSEDLFDVLPTDGGVITIQGCGSIFKLFPIQNGMLVFCANGVWFITGSQGIGFSATDYTITKISNVPSISSTSFVDVLGLPVFWNEDGIYQVSNTQQGQLSVESMTVSTIDTFYGDIPLNSKKYVRGAYNPIEYTIQWVYRSTTTSDIFETYNFDRILNYNTFTKAFFPYTISAGPTINNVMYVTSPGGSDAPESLFKYRTSYNLEGNQAPFTYVEEWNEDYLDWTAYNGGVKYESYFITGYHLKGQAMRKFQPQYIYMFSRGDDTTAYKIQAIWDYAANGNSGRFSQPQTIINGYNDFKMRFRRIKLRGNGIALQIKVSSVDDFPFDIMGWTMPETVNAGV